MELDSIKFMIRHQEPKLADYYSKIDVDVKKVTSLKIVEHVKRLGFQEDAPLVKEDLILFRRAFEFCGWQRN